MSAPVLVTGGAGYVGCCLVPELLAHGHRVVVLDLMLYHARRPLRHPNLRMVRGDVRDVPLLRRLLRGCGAVVHLAGVSLDGARLDPGLAREINVGSLHPLLREAERAGVRRFVFASSCSVYGNAAGGAVDEDTPPAPEGPYAEAKLRCEEVLRGHAGALETVAVRAATVCGASPRQRLDLFVNRMAVEAALSGRVAVGDGARVRPSVHVADLARLYRSVLEAPAAEVAGGVFNVAYENRTVADTALLVGRLTGSEAGVGGAGAGDARSYHVRSDRVAARLGFAPRTGVADAVREISGAVRRGAFADPLASPLYHNRRMEAETLSAVPAERGVR